MLINSVLFPVNVLGPGNRLVIWTQGCSKKCENCIAQSLQPFEVSKDIEVDALVDSIKKELADEKIDGITISGGDPMEQFEELHLLVKKLHCICNDIIVYTGYEEYEIEELFGKKAVEDLKKHISVLIVGRYVDSLNDNRSPMIGSTNQKIIYTDKSCINRYTKYLKEGRHIQNVLYGDKIISVGIHGNERNGRNEYNEK